MPEVFWVIRICQVVALSMDERIFSKSKNRFGTIAGMIIRSWEALVPPEGILSIFDSTRTNMIKPRFFNIRGRESMWNELLHRRDNHLCDALSTHRGAPDLETVIIPKEIGKVLPLVLPPRRVKMPEAPPPRWVQRLYRSNRTVYKNKVVIGGA